MRYKSLLMRTGDRGRKRKLRREQIKKLREEEWLDSWRILKIRRTLTTLR
jgi:hypothetical protein